MTSDVQLAIYSLFKQAELGDVTEEDVKDEMKRNNKKLGHKIRAYMSQRGKSTIQAMAEYVMVVSEHNK